MRNKKLIKPEPAKQKISQPATAKKGDKKTIENFKLAAAHHVLAAKHFTDAAKHYELGNKEKSAQSTVLAYGHNAIAGEFVSDDAKHHSQVLKRTHHPF